MLEKPKDDYFLATTAERDFDEALPQTVAVISAIALFNVLSSRDSVSLFKVPRTSEEVITALLGTSGTSRPVTTRYPNPMASDWGWGWGVDCSKFCNERIKLFLSQDGAGTKTRTISYRNHVN